jgi:hypothetical protein
LHGLRDPTTFGLVRLLLPALVRFHVGDDFSQKFLGVVSTPLMSAVIGPSVRANASNPSMIS